MRILGIGHVLFAISVAGLALLALAYGNFAPELEPLPDWRTSREVWSYEAAIILLAAAGGLLVARTASVSAAIIAVCGLIWAAARARALFLEPLSVGSWYGFCEAVGPIVGAWILYAHARRECDPAAPTATATAMTGERALHAARLLFGAACVAYGAAHFAYAAYTAAMVPAWLPGRMVLVYCTGACHAAAGFALLAGVRRRLAATLEAAMMTLFGVLVWLPAFFLQPRPSWSSSMQIQWSETFLTFLLAGAAWVVAASLTPRHRA